MHRSHAERIWESSGLFARSARALLSPLGWLYGSAVRVRNHAYDAGWLASHPLALPSVSVGNLTVGGTGKTPVAAWLVQELRAAGARPAVVMRGYGGDEIAVHERLSPGVPVIADPDRVRGALEAKAGGATVVVLDDAFQHRRAIRDADVVLLSADRSGPVRPLPAGPWREPLDALRRARIIVVTRKQASSLRAKELLASARRFAPQAEGAVVHLAMDALVPAAGGAAVPLSALSGEEVLAISGVGDPRAFQSQLRAVGARVAAAVYADHHRYTRADADALAARAGTRLRAVCTLKDAVKLATLWPAQASPLWYLSQRVDVEIGEAALRALIVDLASRGTST